MKQSKKSLKNKLDKLWSLIIHKKTYCELCGKSGQNAHHVIGRINYSLRWDIRNGCLLCIACHFQVHNNPIMFMEWFKSKRPDDYEYLKDPKFTKTKTWYLYDYEQIYKELKEVICEK